MSVIPPEVAPAAMACDAFVVEDLRSARRYLRKIGFTKNFDELPFFEMTKGADQTNLSVFIKKNIELLILEFYLKRVVLEWPILALMR